MSNKYQQCPECKVPCERIHNQPKGIEYNFSCGYKIFYNVASREGEVQQQCRYTKVDNEVLKFSDKSTCPDCGASIVNQNSQPSLASFSCGSMWGLNVTEPWRRRKCVKLMGKNLDYINPLTNVFKAPDSRNLLDNFCYVDTTKIHSLSPQPPTQTTENTNTMPTTSTTKSTDTGVKVGQRWAFKVHRNHVASAVKHGTVTAVDDHGVEIQTALRKFGFLHDDWDDCKVVQLPDRVKSNFHISWLWKIRLAMLSAVTYWAATSPNPIVRATVDTFWNNIFKK